MSVCQTLYVIAPKDKNNSYHVKKSIVCMPIQVPFPHYLKGAEEQEVEEYMESLKTYRDKIEAPKHPFWILYAGSNYCFMVQHIKQTVAVFPCQEGWLEALDLMGETITDLPDYLKVIMFNTSPIATFEHVSHVVEGQPTTDPEIERLYGPQACPWGSVALLLQWTQNRFIRLSCWQQQCVIDLLHLPELPSHMGVVMLEGDLVVAFITSKNFVCMGSYLFRKSTIGPMHIKKLVELHHHGSAGVKKVVYASINLSG